MLSFRHCFASWTILTSLWHCSLWWKQPTLRNCSFWWQCSASGIVFLEWQCSYTKVLLILVAMLSIKHCCANIYDNAATLRYSSFWWQCSASVIVFHEGQGLLHYGIAADTERITTKQAWCNLCTICRTIKVLRTSDSFSKTQIREKAYKWYVKLIS